jgi:hypothetical protein
MDDLFNLYADEVENGAAYLSRDAFAFAFLRAHDRTLFAIDAAFDVADTDNDGRLSRAEFNALVTLPATVASMTPLTSFTDGKSNGDAAAQHILAALCAVDGNNSAPAYLTPELLFPLLKTHSAADVFAAVVVALPVLENAAALHAFGGIVAADGKDVGSGVADKDSNGAAGDGKDDSSHRRDYILPTSSSAASSASPTQELLGETSIIDATNNKGVVTAAQARVLDDLFRLVSKSSSSSSLSSSSSSSPSSFYDAAERDRRAVAGIAHTKCFSEDAWKIVTGRMTLASVGSVRALVMVMCALCTLRTHGKS